MDDAATVDDELMHLWALDRGILLTASHDMARISHSVLSCASKSCAGRLNVSAP